MSVHAVVVIIVAVLLGCGPQTGVLKGTAGNDSLENSTETERSQPLRQCRLGFNLVTWSGNSTASQWSNALKEMADAGACSVTILTYRFVNQETGELSRQSAFGLNSPPKDSVLSEAVSFANSLGLRVNLSLLLEVDNPIGIGQIWRGDLQVKPANLQSFFGSYKQSLDLFIAMASSKRVEHITIGTELKRLVRGRQLTKQWQQLIAKVRSELPADVRLTYASNHDNYKQVGFWNELDDVGVNAYFSLASESDSVGLGNPSAIQVGVGFKKALDELEKFSLKVGKPVFITEWGLVPFDKATSNPWNWSPSELIDPKEQLNAFAGVLDQVSLAESWLSGLQAWHWGMQGQTAAGLLFSPAQKWLSSLKETETIQPRCQFQ